MENRLQRTETEGRLKRHLSRVVIALTLIPVVLCISSPCKAQTTIDTLYIVSGSHLDVGFTDPPMRVRQKRIKTLDDAIHAANANPDFHWLEESAWAFNAWVEHHRNDEARLESVSRLLRNGQLAVGATWVSPHAAPFPELLPFLTVHLEELERDFGYRPTVAVLNDPPSYPVALVDVLAARVVRYMLIGANMSFTPPLPARLSRTPFWWESAGGSRVLVYIDPDGFTAGFTHWGIDPDCARFFNPERFPPDRGALETMESGITAMLKESPSAYDALVIQHALDNWDTTCAERLPGHVQQWNDAGKRPYLKLAPPEAYFGHIEERYGETLPVYQGEWGGQWGAIRANVPVWTWRLRQAARALPEDASREAKVALATVLDHNLQLGPVRSGFTEKEFREHARQNAELFARAVELSLGKAGLESLPPAPPMPSLGPLPEEWKRLFGDERPARLRAGKGSIAPFVSEEAPLFDAPLELGADANRLVVRTRLDRTKIPDGHVVIEFPLRAELNNLRLVPERSPSAAEGRWLRGEPPPFVIAPHGVRVEGLVRYVSVRSAVVFTWTLVPDRSDPRITWLQGLVVRQATVCELKGGAKKQLPFEVLYPGEPTDLEVTLELEILAQRTPGG